MSVAFKWTATIFWIIALVLMSSMHGGAKDIQKIAAVVNDEIISVRDVENRAHLVVVLSKLPNTIETRRRLGPRVLRSLIDEKLQSQEAKRLNVTATKSELAAARTMMENRIRARKGGFAQFLESNGIDEQTALSEIHTSLVWTKLVRRRFNNVATVSEEEIDEVLDRFERNLGQPQFRASEILVHVEEPGAEEMVLKNVERLVAELRKGASFASLAREFSSAASAASGGQIGWISPGQLDTRLETPLRKMKIGGISEPIRTVFGYHILKLEDRRVLTAIDPMQAKVTLKHVFLPAPATQDKMERESQLAIAKAIGSSVENCGDMDALAKEVKSPASSDLGIFRIGELAPEMRNAVSNLKVGEASEPVDLPTGFSVIMVCNRVDPPSNIPSRKDVRPRLLAQKLEALARRYLRDLRRDAFIETRI
ncbi:MAG: hypothetical protein CMM47_06890 [Rhodospirillaceae bacterium]|nr:hypothetical protein [Rhodospirillaceae bacterium]|tara:strand:- start:77 stop:1351 length:1275 start_codon:yes stop_codon:yes gene_type:complete